MKIIKKFLQEQPTDSNPKRTIAIDFDGVTHFYSKGLGDGTIYDPPFPGVKEALEEISKKYDIVCFTARIQHDPSGNGKQSIIDWMKKYNLLEYFKDITNIKPAACAYIDDLAIHHIDWPTTMNELKSRGLI